MDFAESVQTDYAIIDGIERVTIRDESEGTTVTNVAAKRSQLSFRELSFGGGAGYDATDVAWRLYADTIAFAPKPGDVVREATGETWSIVSVVGCRIGNVVVMGWDGLVSIDGTIMQTASADFGKKGSILARDGMRGTRQHVDTDAVAGPYRVGGSITIEPSIAELAALAALVLGTDEALDTFIILVDRSQAAFTYDNCCLNKLTISGSQGGLIKAVCTPVGTTEASGSALNAPTSAEPLSFADVELVVGSVTCTPQSFDLSIDNAIDEGRFLNSSTLTLNADSTMDATDRIVMLKVVVPYDSDHAALYDLSIAGEAASLTIGTVVFTFGKLKAPAEPVPLAKGELFLTLNLQAMKTGSTADVAVSGGTGS